MQRTSRMVTDSPCSTSASQDHYQSIPPYQVGVALGHFLQDAAVNFRISNNRTGTMGSLRALIRTYPRNVALIEFKHQVAKFYDTILKGDFDAFSALYPVFSIYIKTASGVAKNPFFIFDLLNPFSNTLTLSQRLFLQRVMIANFLPITKRISGQFYTINQAWICFLRDGSTYRAKGGMLKIYFRIQAYFNSEKPIDSRLKAQICRLEMTAAALFNFARQLNQIDQLRRLLTELPHLKLQLTARNKTILCPPGTDISQVLDYCSDEERSILNQVYFPFKEKRFPSFQAACTDLIDLLNAAPDHWFIKVMAQDLRASLYAVMKLKNQDRLFMLQQSTANAVVKLLSKMHFNCHSIFENYPKAQISERMHSEQFFDKLLCKLNAYPFRNPNLAANIQEIEALRTANRVWIDHINKQIEEEKRKIIMTVEQARDWQFLPPFIEFLEPLQLNLESLFTQKNYQQLLLKYYPHEAEGLVVNLRQTLIAIRQVTTRLNFEEELTSLWKKLDSETSHPKFFQGRGSEQFPITQNVNGSHDEGSGKLQYVSICNQLFFSNSLSSSPLFSDTSNTRVENRNRDITRFDCYRGHELGLSALGWPSGGGSR